MTSLYVIIARFLSYETVTTVAIPMKKEELPPNGEYFAALFKAKKEWKSYPGINITLNGCPVDFSKSFFAPHYIDPQRWYINWDIIPKCNQSKFLDEKLYELHGEIPNWRILVKKLKVGSKYQELRFGFMSVNISVAYNIILIRLLPAPYDTKCYDYKVSNKHCQVECQMSKESVSRGNVAQYCLDRCSAKDCIELSVSRTFRKVESNVPRVLLGDRILSVVSATSFSKLLLWQTVVGLITMFFDISISDLSMLASYGMRKTVAIKIAWLRRGTRRICRWTNKLIRIMAYIGLVYQLYTSIKSYMNLDTSSRTFLGLTSNMIDVPNLLICPDGHSTLSVNLTVFKTEYPTVAAAHGQCAFVNTSKFEYTKRLPMFKLESHTDNYIAGFRYSRQLGRSILDIVSSVAPGLEYSTRFFATDLLPAPYHSKCVNYDTSYRHRFEDCLKNCIGINSTITTLHTALGKFAERCHEQFKYHDCHAVDIEVNKIKPVRAIQRVSTINNYDEALTIRMFPTQSPVDFFTYTASLLGLWLGLSVLDFVSEIGSIVMKHISLKMSAGRSWISTSMKISMIILCNIQLYLIISGYLAYEISSKVSLGRPDNYRLPVVSLYVKSKNIGKKSDNLLSPNQFYHSYNFSSDIRIIGLVDPANITAYTQYTVEDLEKFLQKSVVMGSLVYTFELNSFSPIVYDKFFARRSQRFLIFIEYKNHLDQTKNIKMHGATIDFFSSIQEPFPINIKTYYILPTLYETSLLPAPYSSNCVQVHGLNPFVSCIKKRHFGMYEKHPNTVASMVSSNVSRMDPDVNILDHCSNFVGIYRKCKENSYSIQVAGIRSDIFGLGINPPLEKTSTIFSPRTLLYDLLILISDAFGLWLGISLALILNKMKETFKIFESPSLEEFLVGQ